MMCECVRREWLRGCSKPRSGPFGAAGVLFRAWGGRGRAVPFLPDRRRFPGRSRRRSRVALAPSRSDASLRAPLRGAVTDRTMSGGPGGRACSVTTAGDGHRPGGARSARTVSASYTPMPVTSPATADGGADNGAAGSVHATPSCAANIALALTPALQVCAGLRLAVQVPVRSPGCSRRAVASAVRVRCRR